MWCYCWCCRCCRCCCNVFHILDVFLAYEFVCVKAQYGHPKWIGTTIGTNHSYKVIFSVSCVCVFWLSSKTNSRIQRPLIETNIKMKRISSICPFHPNGLSYCGEIYLHLCANICLMSNARTQLKMNSQRYR